MGPNNKYKFWPMAQAQGGPRTGVISINTSFGTWAQAHWDPRTGVIYFYFYFLTTDRMVIQGKLRLLQ